MLSIKAMQHLDEICQDACLPFMVGIIEEVFDRGIVNERYILALTHQAIVKMYEEHIAPAIYSLEVDIPREPIHMGTVALDEWLKEEGQ